MTTDPEHAGGENGASQPKLSVVIPCLNAADTIGEQLEALTHQQWSERWEVVVIDNGSTDDSLAVVERHRGRLPSLRIVDGSRKRSQAYALNRGAEEAQGEWIAFVDADDVVGEGWLPAVGDALSRHQFVAYRQEDSLLNEPWVRMTRERTFSEALPRTWFPPHVDYCGAGCIAIHKRLHEEVGGFDESLFLQDLDYCIRLQGRGATLHFASEAVLHSRYRDSLGGIFRQAYRYARGVAEVQRRYKRRGERYPNQGRWLIIGWRPMLPRLARVWQKGHRAKLAWQLGWQLGRIHGSIEHRVLAV